VRHPYPINGIPVDTTMPSKREDLFAIIGFSGTQYKVTMDDVIVADRMEGVDIGQLIDLSEVLLVGSRRATVIGRPLVEGAKVIAAVEEITRDKKVIAFKTRRRKHSRRLKGFRREVTILRIADIVLGDKMTKEELSSLL
jgi:large subunit ribosomal protein L21